MKKALNVFGIIFAVIFSLALILTLIMTPVWKGVSGLLEPEFLQNVVIDVVAELDIEQLIADAATLESELNSMFLELQTDLHTEYAEVLALLTGPVVTTALLITALILAALIFLCRWPHQEGLLWLGIDSALAALPVLGIAISFKGAQFSQALAAGTGLPNVFAPVLRQAGNATLAGGALLLAAAVLLIGGYVLLRDRRMKREAAYADRAPAAQPTAQAAPFSVDETRERSPWDNV